MYQKTAGATLLLLLLVGFFSITVAEVGAKGSQTATETEGRDKITYADLAGSVAPDYGMVDNRFFAPQGEAGPARHEFEGSLTVEAAQMRMALLGDSTAYFDNLFPGFSVDFFTYEDNLVPAERDLLKDSPGRWELMLAPGKVWSEPADKGMSRAAFPFVMVPYNRWFSYNGLATFLYDETIVSDFRFQIVQEAAPPEARFDAWAQFPMRYTPGPIANREILAAGFAAELARRLPLRSWSELENSYDPALLAGLIGNLPQEEIASAGIVIDGVIYAQPSMTRYGEYPYPETMRHSVYSMSKSMGAALALLHLAQKYGPEVFELKIADYIGVTADHNGWAEVTFADALNMATGIGDVVPEPRPLNIDADSDDEKGRRFWLAETAEKKLAVVFSYGNYAWGPGEIARYTDRNTFVLSAAMDSFLKSREGPDRHLWDMVSEEVLRPIGVYHLPMIHTRETDGSPGIPFMGVGAYPTMDDVAKIAQLFQDGGFFEGQQLLHPAKTEEALYRAGQSGLPTGKRFAHGDQAYNLSFWGIAHRTAGGRYFQVPFMSGWGGNTIFLAPNGISTFVFTDYGPDTYTLSTPQFTEALRPYPAGGVSVNPSPEYALVMRGIWLIPEHQQQALLLNGILLVWIGLTAASLVLVLIHRRHSETVKDGSAAGWLLLILLTGPFGLLIYWRRARRQEPGSMESSLAMS